MGSWSKITGSLGIHVRKRLGEYRVSPLSSGLRIPAAGRNTLVMRQPMQSNRRLQVPIMAGSTELRQGCALTPQ